jgi:hypothetical protein
MAWVRSKRFGMSPQDTVQTEENRPSGTASAPKTLSVPEAGRIYFGLGRNASYAAAARGELPIIEIWSRLRVAVVALDRMLESAATSGSSTPDNPTLAQWTGIARPRHQQRPAAMGHNRQPALDDRGDFKSGRQAAPADQRAPSANAVAPASRHSAPPLHTSEGSHRGQPDRAAKNCTKTGKLGPKS